MVAQLKIMNDNDDDDEYIYLLKFTAVKNPRDCILLWGWSQTKDEKRYMLLKMIHVAWFVTVGKHKASDQWGPTSCLH